MIADVLLGREYVEICIIASLYSGGHCFAFHFFCYFCYYCLYVLANMLFLYENKIFCNVRRMMKPKLFFLAKKNYSKTEAYRKREN